MTYLAAHLWIANVHISDYIVSKQLAKCQINLIVDLTCIKVNQLIMPLAYKIVYTMVWLRICLFRMSNRTATYIIAMADHYNHPCMYLGSSLSK